jgi:hypothetical protein
MNAHDGKTDSQIACMLTDNRWLSIILDTQTFREADCDTDQYMVAAKVRWRLSK